MKTFEPEWTPKMEKLYEKTLTLTEQLIIRITGLSKRDQSLSLRIAKIITMVNNSRKITYLKRF